MNEIEIDLSKCIDNFKIDKDKAEQYGGYEKIANDLSKENIKLAFENTILQSKIDKTIEFVEEYKKQWVENDEVVNDMNNLENILKEDK